MKEAILAYHFQHDVSGILRKPTAIRSLFIERVQIINLDTPNSLLPPEHVSDVKSRCQVISSQMFDGMVRLRVISKSGRPGDEFASAPASLEDFYFETINQARGSQQKSEPR